MKNVLYTCLRCVGKTVESNSLSSSWSVCCLSIRESVRPSPWDYLAPTGRIFIKVDNLELFEEIVMKTKVPLKSDEIVSKPTGHVMHQQFNIQRSAHTVFMCFVFI